jgi:hypothetical protein
MTNECPHCNTHNPPQAVTCRVCNLTVPRSNPSPLSAGRTLPKLAVFDLDKTVLDLSRRERIAKRQGIKPKSQKWFDFLNQNQYALMDTAIPGTIPFIKSLSADGYTIAYLSGRPNSIIAATKQNLQELGFPIDASLDRDLVFLHSGGKPSLANLTNHKKGVLTHLKSMFDIHFFFDDTPEFREAAKSLFVPGVYSSISSYTGKEVRPSAPKKPKSRKPRNNPSELRCPEHGMLNYDEIETIEEGAIHPFTGEIVVGPVSIHKGCGLNIKAHGNVKPNPPPKPRKKRNKAGKMIKEPSKKYIRRFMADPKMNSDFPKSKQRYAVAMTYAAKFYGKKIFSNPPIVFDKDGNQIMVSSEEAEDMRTILKAEAEAEAIRLKAEAEAAFMKKFGTDMEGFGTQKEEPPPVSAPLVGSLIHQLPKWEDVEEEREIEDLKEAQERIMKHREQEVHRSNPHFPVTKAKEFYKQFHKKAPSNIKKKKIDFGDTWVGLGKAWSIGYRSGKETGDDSQKYIHNFGVDEESGKTFKEPDVYYVKNNDGSQMMVIMGGDWYIDVDADGEVSWIYV